MSIAVVVKVKGGDAHTFNFPSTATVGALRARIVTAGIAPASKQRLLVKGKSLDDDSKTLAQAGISDSSPVALVVDGPVSSASSSVTSSVSQAAILQRMAWLRDVPEADRERWFKSIGADQEKQFGEAQRTVTAAHALLSVTLKPLPEASGPAPSLVAHVRQSNSVPPSSLHPMYPLVHAPSVAYLTGNDKDAVAKEHAEWTRMCGSHEPAATSSSAGAGANVPAAFPATAAPAPAVIARAKLDLSKLLTRVIQQAAARTDAQARRQGNGERNAAAAAGAVEAGLLPLFAKALAKDAAIASKVMWAQPSAGKA
jgi:hypothetical protein